MGSNIGEDNEQPVHVVTLPGFAMGRTEVTHRQWRAVMGRDLNFVNKCGADCPVTSLNWDDTQQFLALLNQRTGKAYRLPSEAEWEYACLAGHKHLYCGSNDLSSVGWYGSRADPVGNSADDKNPVAQKQPNAWGLFDMAGNASEWTQDCWNDNYVGAPSDGSAWTSGDCQKRVLRGGNYLFGPLSERATRRSKELIASKYSSQGFRLALSLP